MKTIRLNSLLLILGFWAMAITGAGQNWRNICSPGTTFFKYTANYFEAFRRDSIYVLPAQDTMFVSYRTIIPQSYNYLCLDTTNGSILGRKVYEKSGGTFYFFNWNYDTISIKTQAVLNDTWTFFSLSNNAKIEAKVIAIGTDSVPGGTDLVKTISLQAKNSSGTNIPYYLNQTTIKLSQHYGLTKMLDVDHINDSGSYMTTTTYSLAGKTSPVMGIQPFDWTDVYNLQDGDVFHYHGFEHFNNVGPEWWLIQQVLTKTISSNGDTIHYLMDNCKLTQLPMPPPNLQKLHNTISMTIVFSSLDSSIYRLPMEFLRTWDPTYGPSAASYSQTVNYNGRLVQDICAAAYSVDNDTCWNYTFEGGNENDYYSPGLGLTEYTILWFDGGMYDWESHLVYFEKGSETWGTPVSDDCSTLLGTDQVSNSEEKNIMIVPNPVDQNALIILPEKGQVVHGYYVLSNELGNQVMKVPVKSSQFTIDRNNLSSGLYFIVVTDENGTLIGSAKILLR